MKQELEQICAVNQVSIQVYSPLEQGLLAGKVTSDTVFKEEDVRNKNWFYQPQNRKKIFSVLAGWQPLCEKYHCSTSNLVICLSAETMNKLHILCGARKPEQILENTQALKLQLEQCDCEKMMKDLSKLNFF